MDDVFLHFVLFCYTFFSWSFSICCHTWLFPSLSLSLFSAFTKPLWLLCLSFGPYLCVFKARLEKINILAATFMFKARLYCSAQYTVATLSTCVSVRSGSTLKVEVIPPHRMNFSLSISLFLTLDKCNFITLYYHLLSSSILICLLPWLCAFPPSLPSSLSLVSLSLCL